MTKRPTNMSLDELVASFVEVSIAQGEAAEEFRVSIFNRLVDREIKILDELKRRDGDERRVLISLYDHPNTQVRLNAAKSTYALNSVEARRVIQTIADSNYAPWSGSAGMTLWALDEGISKLVS